MGRKESNQTNKLSKRKDCQTRTHRLTGAFDDDMYRFSDRKGVHVGKYLRQNKRNNLISVHYMDIWCLETTQ